MNITVHDLQTKARIDPRRITALAKTILRHQRIADADLSLVFVGHQKIRALNRKFLGRDYATDVLAFDLRGEKSSKGKPRTVIGDIIISTDAAVKSARALATGLSGELGLYIAHGILHLTGYDDHSAGETKRMRAQEQKVMKHVGAKVNAIARPRR